MARVSNVFGESVGRESHVNRKNVWFKDLMHKSYSNVLEGFETNSERKRNTRQKRLNHIYSSTFQILKRKLKIKEYCFQNDLLIIITSC